MDDRVMRVEKEISELIEASSNEIIAELKQQWGYESHEELEVIGELKLYSGGSSYKPFYRIENLTDIKTGQILENPLTRRAANAYVENQGYLFEQERVSIFSEKVQFRPSISPISERRKHNNPFLLTVKSTDLIFLSEVPKEITADSIITIEGQDYLEQWVIEQYRLKNADLLQQEYETLKSQLESQQAYISDKVVTLKQERNVLREEHEILTHEVTISQQELNELSKRILNLNQEYHHQEEILEHRLMSLKKLVEQRTESLLKLDLITEEELNHLLGVVDEVEHVEGYSFTDQFNGNYDNAIAYIQAFLFEKGIIYRRSVLADFLALLISNDLIILAGDSGSGKTHLVKSFADAIGGKSIIIPVKPNWTSAEDLLGYYNPLENRYISTPFLDALIEASKHPEVPYLICLDEMNLAKVEYYFADFLSLLEERDETPEISLFSDTESEILATEVRNFIALIDEAKIQTNKSDLMSFLDILRDAEMNRKLQELCGFKEGDSLLTYHVRLKRMISSYLGIPSKIKMPENVRIIGAINVDETTHYLSPKILDRAHIMKFSSPLLIDWSEIEAEIEDFPYEVDRPLIFPSSILNRRGSYPSFDKDDLLVQFLVRLVREYLNPLGVEFGLRTIRQALNYRDLLRNYESITDGVILNQIMLHKVLPKMMFDGNRALLSGSGNENILRKDHLAKMLDQLKIRLDDENLQGYDSSLEELRALIDNAITNDGVVNYWTR